MSATLHPSENGANAKRLRIAALKADIRAGRIDLADVLLNPPADLEAHLLIEVAQLARGDARTRRGRWVTLLGREAIREGVNLMLPLGRASLRSRTWVAENVQRATRKRSV